MSDPLLDAFADALRDEPAPLPEDARARLVRAAMERAEDEALVDAFADALRTDEPVEHAPGAAAERAVERSGLGSRRWVAGLAVASVVLAIGVGLWAQALFTRAPSQADGLVEHHLAGGHRIVATSAATLRIEEAGERVRVRLDSGEALFVVDPGSDFAVLAGAARVEVTGTVFQVGRNDDGVAVEVFEGGVRLVTPQGARALYAGERVGRSGDAELVFEGEVAAAARLEVATASSSWDGEPTAPPTHTAAEPSEPSEPSEPTGPIEPPTSIAPDAPAVDPRSEGDTAAARRALAAGRYESALELVDRALRAGSSHERWMIRGHALRGLERPSAALAAYRRALHTRSGPQRAMAGLEAARLLAGPLARPDEARTMLRESGALELSSPVLPAARRLDGRPDPR